MATVQPAGSEPGRAESKRMVSATVIEASPHPASQKAMLHRIRRVTHFRYFVFSITGGQLLKHADEVCYLSANHR